MAVKKTWIQRNHWYLKGLLLLITGAFALTRIPILVGLFIAMALWMFGVIVFALKNAYWVFSRKRQYAKMTQEQRDQVERAMIYQFEDLYAQTHTMLNVSGMLPRQRAAYEQNVKRATTAAEAILMYEKWRAELLDIPARPLHEMRRYWTERDPAWLATETTKGQQATHIRIDDTVSQRQGLPSRHGKPRQG